MNEPLCGAAQSDANIQKSVMFRPRACVSLVYIIIFSSAAGVGFILCYRCSVVPASRRGQCLTVEIGDV